MARMEQAIKNIVDMFVDYSNGDGKLNKAELEKLMMSEIENAEVKAHISSVDCDKALGCLDKNKDGELNFGEYMKCVSFMAKCLYKIQTGKAIDED